MSEKIDMNSDKMFLLNARLASPILLLFKILIILCPVVQRVDYSIQCINCYPADKMFSDQNILSLG